MTGPSKKQPVPFGKYLLLDRINIGGMAEVWRGKAFGAGGFERLVAIKRILPNIAEDDEFVTMFIDEAKISVQLTHANIAQIYDLGQINSSFFIAMEYIPGKDVRAIFDRARKRSEKLPIPLACHIIGKLCDGLDYAHRKKDGRGEEMHIVHRDVSPQNVLISYDGEVKVIDFGIAKAAGKANRTQAGILKGKFGYMSPEQVRGLEIDRRADIFAIGICLFELLTGERLFVGETDFAVLEKVRGGQVPRPSSVNPEIPPALERIVLKALAPDREQRYQHASELADDLAAFSAESGEVAGQSELVEFMLSMFAEEIGQEEERLREYEEIKPPEGFLEAIGLTLRRTTSGTLRSIDPANLPPPPVAPAPPPPQLAQADDDDENGATLLVESNVVRVALGVDDTLASTKQSPEAGRLVPGIPVLVPMPSGSKPPLPPSAAILAAAAEVTDPGLNLALIPPDERGTGPVGLPADLSDPSITAPDGLALGQAEVTTNGRAPMPGLSQVTTNARAPLSPEAGEAHDDDDEETTQSHSAPAHSRSVRTKPERGPRPSSGLDALRAQWTRLRSSTPKWSIPVAIGALLLVSVVGIVFAVREPAMGYVLVDVPAPLRAQVHLTLNGKDLPAPPSWPLLTRVEAGKALVTAHADGYAPFAKTVQVAAGDRPIQIEIALRSMLGTGKLVVAADPADATVLLDGRPIKREGDTGFASVDLPVGELHEVRVEKKGYAPYSTQVVARKHDQEVTVKAKLEELLVPVSVSSMPAGAEILIAGKSVGTTPMTLKLTIATPSLTLQKHCYGSVDLAVPFPANGRGQVTLHGVLHAQPGCR